MPNETVICLGCHKPIINGRADKKFCNSTCKDNYYNRLKKETKKAIAEIDATLKRNRAILKTLHAAFGKEKLIARNKLLKQGLLLNITPIMLPPKFTLTSLFFATTLVTGKRKKINTRSLKALNNTMLLLK